MSQKNLPRKITDAISDLEKYEGVVRKFMIEKRDFVKYVLIRECEGNYQNPDIECHILSSDDNFRRVTRIEVKGWNNKDRDKVVRRIYRKYRLLQEEIGYICNISQSTVSKILTNA